MKALLCLLAFTLWADEAQDRTAIDRIIVALNDPAERAGLFANGADSTVDFDQLLELHRKPRPRCITTIGFDETWTVLTVPRVVSGSIRFVSPEVAIVEGASVIRGAVTFVPRVPLLFVMKKEGGQWRITAAKVLAHRRGML